MMQNVDVYYMSILQRLTILTSARLPLEAYASLGVDTSPSSTVAVSTKMRRYLCRYPCLDIILFYFPEDGLPIVYGTHLQPSLFVDPSQWESLGHRGAIVRQYRPPDDPGVSIGDPTEVFWHVRVFTRVAIHHTGRKFVGAKRHWLDMAYFRGRTVPRDVLQAAYAAHGEDPEFLQGGRSLRMKERAWDILRSWRAAQTEPTGGDEGEDSASGDDEAHEGGDEDEQASDDEEEDGLGDSDQQALDMYSFGMQYGIPEMTSTWVSGGVGIGCKGGKEDETSLVDHGMQESFMSRRCASLVVIQ